MTNSPAYSQQLVFGGGSSASGLFGSSVSLGGDASNSIVTTPGETTGRSTGTRAGDVYNLADHGADGTAANDTAALNKAIAYATTRSNSGGYTIIYLPQNLGGNPWAFTASSLFTFCFPSNTEFAGAGKNATSITWNDNNGNGWYLFGSSFNSNGSLAGVRPVNITLRDFKMVGTWGPNGTYVRGTTWDGVGSVDGLTIRNVESDYSRGFGLAAGFSTNVLFESDVVNYSFADGISAQATSNLEMVNLKLNHVNDDCLSAHEEQGAPETVRRDILIGNVQCFDTQAIDIAAPLHLSIDHVLMISPKGSALAISDQGVGGHAEGASAVAGVAVSNFTVLNPIQRGAIDTYNAIGTAISLGFAPARTGTTTPLVGQSGYVTPNAIPGYGTTGQGYIRDPYPEWMTNSNNASVAMNGATQLSFENIAVVRTMPGADGKVIDGSDNRFLNFASFGQGNPQAAYGPATPTATESNLRLPCFSIVGGYIHGLSIHNFTCSGQDNGIAVGDGGAVSHMDNITVDGAHIFDLTGPGVYVGMSNAASTLQMVVRNSDFDMDPFPADPSIKGYRMPGPQTSMGISSLSWANGVVTVTLTSAPSPAFLTDQNATISNVAGNGVSSAYNGRFPITVTGAKTFTYPLASNPGSVTPANNATASVPTPPPFAAGAVFGGWQGVDYTYCGYVAICQGSNTQAGAAFPVQGGVLVMNSTFKNAASETNVDTTSTTSGWTFRNNYDYAQISVPYAFSQSNLGIGFPHPGFEIINMDSNPNDAAYGLIGPVKPGVAPSYPTTGVWSPGDKVWNDAVSPSNTTAYWLRATQTNTAGTSGAPTNYVLGTDWIAK